MENQIVLDSNTFKDAHLNGVALKIHTYPDSVLSKVAKPVEVFDSKLIELCRNMLFTMYHAPGIGLAAPQIGISQRIVVIDINYKRDKITNADDSETIKLSEFEPLVLINPVIKSQEGSIDYEEGCLSVPGVYEKVNRKQSIKVEYQNIYGEKCTLDATDLLAICIQHETDHLNGIVFIERLSLLKMKFFKNKMIKEKKLMQNE
ncbi:MAG: peptide deformylase [Bacteriovoracaceae bacterium]